MNTVAVLRYSFLTLIAVVISLVMLKSNFGHETEISQLDSAAKTQTRTSGIWEYKVSRFNGNELEAELNKLGAEGWELVQFLSNGNAVFKREKHNSGVTSNPYQPANQSVWHGDWDTDWGPMNISVTTDGTATGIYGVAKHKIAGKVDPATPNVLSGIWTHSDSNLTGGFRFEITQHNQFKGKWSQGNEVLDVGIPNWVGKKSLPNSNPGVEAK